MKCPICQSSNVRQFTDVNQTYHPYHKYEYKTTRSASYYLCSSCDHIFQMPLPTEEQIRIIYEDESYFAFPIEKLQEEYEYEKKRFPKEQAGKRLSQIMKLISDNNIHNPSLLDIGCGHGIMVKLAENFGISAKGIDLSEYWISASRKILGANVFVEDVFAIEQEKFDIITLYDVIEHLTDPMSFMIHIKSLLKPNGFIIILTPNSKDWFGRNIYKSRWEQLLANEHLNLFSKHSMMKFATNCGMKVVDIKPDRTVKTNIGPFGKRILSNLVFLCTLRLSLIKQPWFFTNGQIITIGSYTYFIQCE